MRSFDGVQYSWESRGRQLLLMGALPTQGVFDVDGWGWVDDVRIAYGALTLPVRFGGSTADARLFALYYDDHRTVPRTDNRPAPARDADREPIGITTVGGHWLQVTPTEAGPVDILLWGAFQTGSWGRLDHRGAAGSLELGIQPRLGALRPWVRIGLFRGSGDGDPADDDHRTFFQVLPTPRPYARFPFYDFSNTTEIFANVIVRPGPVTLRAGVHRIRLSEAEDLWYVGGGAFDDETFGYAGRPGGGSRSLATVADVGVSWPAHRWLSLELYGALAFEGDVIRGIHPDAGNGRLLYLEAELRR